MIRIAICDDYFFADQIKKYLNMIQDTNFHIKVQTRLFSSANELLEVLSQKINRFDVIFSNIKMHDMDTVTLGRSIRDLYDNILVYTSVCNEHLIEMFNIKPFGFLVKPLVYEDFKKAFFAIYNELHNFKDIFEFKINKSNIRVKYNDIIYFKSSKRKIELETIQGSYEFYGQIPMVHESLKNSKFMRIHKSYLINYNHISKINYDYVIMSNGEKFDISNRRRKEIKHLYSQF